jgi:phosphate-selective porin OprO and OprP
MDTLRDVGSSRKGGVTRLVVLGIAMLGTAFLHETMADESATPLPDPSGSVLSQDSATSTLTRVVTDQPSEPLVPSSISSVQDELPSFPQNLTPLPRSSDSYPTFRLRGRLEMDTLLPVQSGGNQQVFGDLADTTGLRRARIGAEGNFSRDSRYVGEIDLASGNVVIRDLYVARGDIREEGEWKFGHMREPFSLEGGTSANSFAFMERSLINTLDPARNWGMSYNRCGASERSTVVAGIFQAGTDPSDVVYNPGCTTAFTTRWTGLARYENEGKDLVHFGIAISERIADQGIIIVDQKPGSPLLGLGDSTSSPFLPKIKIPADFQQLIDLQWAYASGPFWSQAEWYGSVIPQNDGGPVVFQGSYLDVGYFVTGEHRKYLVHTGVFGPITVNRPAVKGFSSKSHDAALGYGAWELTGRISYLDFNDTNTPIGPQGQTYGNRVPQSTIGVNWYLADRLRVLFNYSYSVPDEATTGASSANLFAMRIATFW